MRPTVKMPVMLGAFVVALLAIVAFSDDGPEATESGAILPMFVADGLVDGQVYQAKLIGGQPALLPLPVVRPNGPSPRPVPTPDTPVPPAPSVLTARSQAIKTAVETIQGDPAKSNTTAALATVYRELGKQAKSEQWDQDTLQISVNWLTDKALSEQGATNAWKPFRDLVRKHWADMLNDGASDSGFADYCLEVADGLDATLPDQFYFQQSMLLQAGRDGFDIEKWMKLLEFFVKYILPLLLKASAAGVAL